MATSDDQPIRRQAGSEATSKEDLVSWLTAQLDHDEQVARAATAGPWTAEGNGSIVGPAGPLPKLAGHVVCSVGAWDVGLPTTADATHIALHDPSRVLRQVAAYRCLLGLHRECGTGYGRCDDGGHAHGPAGCADRAELASIYSDRPGFDPSWTVE